MRPPGIVPVLVVVTSCALLVAIAASCGLSVVASNNASTADAAPPSVTVPADAQGDSVVATPPDDLWSGLVAYWRFDGNTNDSARSGTTFNPVTKNGTPTYRPGKIDQGWFPGLGTTSLCENCVVLEAPTNAALAFDNDDFTISLWAERQPNPSVDNVWWSYGFFDNGQVRLSASGKGAFTTPVYPTLQLSNNKEVIAEVSVTSFDFRAPENVGKWTHIVAFRRGRFIGLRINGSETMATMGAGEVGPAKVFHLAAIDSGYPWQGTIDEVAKWKRALSGSEMDALYNNGAGRQSP